MPIEQFQLVKLQRGEMVPVYGGDGQLLKFLNGEEAAREASRLMEQLGVKIQPRRIVDKKWREREKQRLADGTYRPLPWASAPWWTELSSIHKDHFPHVSLQKQALVAFTENDEKGSADIQTPLKPGKYLERFFTDEKLANKLDEYTVRDLCTVFASKFESQDLYITCDPEEIEEIYTTGPNSCMSKKASDYGVAVHPSRAYAAGDLSLAYLRRKGRIVARCLVWPDKHLHNNIYGDSALMQPILRKAGYKCAAPIGARLLKIVQQAGPDLIFTVPHIDNASAVVDKGEFLEIRNFDERDESMIKIGSGTGKTEVACQCPECNSIRAKTKLKPYFVRNKANAACPVCIKDKAFQCEITGNYHPKDELLEIKAGTRGQKTMKVATRCITSGHIFKCQGTEEWWHIDYRVILPDGRVWSRPYADKHGTQCECGQVKDKNKACGCYSSRYVTTSATYATGY